MSLIQPNLGPDLRRWIVPSMLLLIGLAWIGGRFPGDTLRGTAQYGLVAIHAVPIVVVVSAVWFGVCGDASTRWQGVLLAVAILVKGFTVFAIVWAMTFPGGFGPHGVLDWLPIGTANAGAGLLLLAFLRTRRTRRTRAGAE